MPNREKRFRSALPVLAGVLLLVLALLMLIGVVLMWRSATAFSPDPASVEVKQDDGFPIVDWEYWQKVNPDVVGWLNIPGTSVSFPVVAASKRNPDFYLDHDINRNWSLFGVPFLDAECQGLNGEVAIIYGHHMDGGSMFTPLERYLGQDFFDEHAEVLVQTPIQRMRLKALGCRVQQSQGTKQVEFSDDEEFHAWLVEQLRESQTVDGQALGDAESHAYERVTLLCTCISSSWTDQRIVLYAG